MKRGDRDENCGDGGKLPKMDSSESGKRNKTVTETE